jgi:hypothetical protein
MIIIIIIIKTEVKKLRLRKMLASLGKSWVLNPG